MRLTSSIRAILLAGSATGILAACSDADVVSPGATNPIQPIVVPGGGGGAGNLASVLVPTTGCQPGTVQRNNVPTGIDSNGDGQPDSISVCAITGNLSGTINLSPVQGFPIMIEGSTFVGVDGGATATLNIAPGTVLFGNDQDGGSGIDLLAVSRGSTINAVGSQFSPIVFTSVQDIRNDGIPDGDGGFSQWGGVSLLGRAPVNNCQNASAVGGSAQCEVSGEGGVGLGGGDQPNDSSGTLRFVRIQHAGFQFSGTNELNGLALWGVGRGTTLENIQIHQNGDDGIEWFGGTVDARFLVVTAADDDQFDWTDGWIGNAQFLLAVQSGSNGDNGIEADNRSTSANNLPRSNPTLSNFTLISNNRTAATNEGIEMRAGTDGRVFNGVVAGFGSGIEYVPATGAPQPVVDSVGFGGNASLGNANGINLLFNGGANNREFADDTLSGILPGPNEASIPPTNPTTLGAFFQAANYAGAFGPADTAASNWTTGWTVAIPGAAATTCPAGTVVAAEVVPASRSEANICIVQKDATTNSITQNVTLTRGNLYRIDGPTFVGVDRGADPANPVANTVARTLTIEPGVTIFANQGTGAGIDLLAVSRGSQIFVNGSEVAPVIMTSRNDVFGIGPARSSATSEWGGLSILGRAPVNNCQNSAATGGTIGCEISGEGGVGLGGGATANDNSGRVNYLQIRYAGFQFSGTNELNGLALWGVGNGTEIEYVQVHNNADDGIEWFGGSVNTRYVVITGANDDSLDWTDGWNGRLQFAIVDQQAQNGDNGIEGDNRSTSANLLPRSNPIVSNVTLVGGGSTSAANEGIELRAGTDGTVINTIVADFGSGVEHVPVSGAPTPVFNSNYIGFAAPQVLGNTDGINLLFNAGANNRQGTVSLATRPGVLGAFVPGANEMATPAINPSTLDPFFNSVNYVGAVENAADDWYVGWTFGL